MLIAFSRRNSKFAFQYPDPAADFSVRRYAEARNRFERHPCLETGDALIRAVAIRLSLLSDFGGPAQ